jgi:acyl-coenzyme A synthetase/AMP-(fatty) acid ligase
MFTLTFHDLLTKNLARRGEHPLVVDRDRQLTYAEGSAEVDATAAWLSAAGVRRGDRVGVHLFKSAEEIVAMFAAARLGAVFVNISHQWTLGQLDYVLRDCGVRVLFTDDRTARALAAVPLPDTLQHVVARGKSPG